MTDEEVIETGCIQLTVTDTNDKPIKNVTILLTDTENVYTGRTDRNGEVTITEVIYGSYDLDISRTGYISIMEDNFTVDDQVTTASYTMTHVDPNPDIVEVDLDEVYTFHVTGKTTPDYQCTVAIMAWLKSNLEGLLDDYNTPVFSKVNYGYNEDTIKGFGKKPVADVYLNNIEYTTDFDDNRPDKVHTIIIVYLKGDMNRTYLKACELTDFLVQEFEENNDFRMLTDFVRTTFVRNVEVQIRPAGKVYGVLCAFELEHDLY